MGVRTQRIAVIGGGVQGVVSAKVYQECGYEVVVIERQEKLGGHWNQAYPGARLQVPAHSYGFPTYPWPEGTEHHPAAEAVSAYVNNAAKAFKLNVRACCEVVKMEEILDVGTKENVGWKVSVKDHSRGGETTTERFDLVVIATGTCGPKYNSVPELPGRESFEGKLATQHDSFADFDGKDVVVMGNGRAAIDMAVLAAERPTVKSVTQVVRDKRWAVPENLGGKPFEETLLSRFGGIMVTCWDHSVGLQRFLHKYCSGIINFFWENVVPKDFFAQHLSDAHNETVKAKPGQEIDYSRVDDILGIAEGETFLRGVSNGVIYPITYTRHVALGNVVVKKALVDALTPSGVRLATGEELKANTVLVAYGAGMIRFPMLPQKHRDIMEATRYGTQLFRHTIHPDIPNVIFHGLNASLLMICTNEVAALWNVARLWGIIKLPPREEMLEEMARIAAWKDANISLTQPHYFGVGARCIYYNDKLLHEIGLNRFRKMPNLYAEMFRSYQFKDYRAVQQEFLQKYAAAAPSSMSAAAVVPAEALADRKIK